MCIFHVIFPAIYGSFFDVLISVNLKFGDNMKQRNTN